MEEEKVIVTKSKIIDIADEIRRRSDIKNQMTLSAMKNSIEFKVAALYCGAPIRFLVGVTTPITYLGKIEIID